MTEKHFVANHFDKDGDLLPEFDDAVDTHSFSVPNGETFTRYKVVTFPDTTPILAGYDVINAPSRGATGNQSVRVKWHYLPFGKIHYRLTVTTKPTNTAVTPFVIVVGADNWVEDATQAIDQRLPFRLVVRGPDATKLRNLLIPFLPRVAGPNGSSTMAVPPAVVASASAVAPSGPPTIIDPIVTPAVLITAAICVSVIAVVGLGTMAAVLLYGISKGANVETSGKIANDLLGELGISFVVTFG